MAASVGTVIVGLRLRRGAEDRETVFAAERCRLTSVLEQGNRIAQEEWHVDGS